jgi:hypothetical protein
VVVPEYELLQVTGVAPVHKSGEAQAPPVITTSSVELVQGLLEIVQRNVVATPA